MGGLIWLLPVSSWAQLETSAEMKWVDSVLNIIHIDQNMDSRTKSNLADSAFKICLQEKDICRQLIARIKQATYLDNMGMADSALTQLYWASHSFKRDCDSNILMSLFTNLTNVYLSLGELSRVDSVSRIALSAWNPAWKEKETRFAILNNLAIAQASRGKIDTATTIFRQAYQEAEADNNVSYIQKGLINLGSIKGMSGDLDSAYFFLSKAADNARLNSDNYDYMTLLINLANLDKNRGRYNHAIVMLDSVYMLADASKNRERLADVQKARADLFARMHKYEKAYGYLIEYIKLNEQNLDEERVKAVTEMMEKYESEKKARQIQQLQLDKLDASLKSERITHARNRYLYIGALVLLVAIGLWSRLHYVHKSRSAIQREKDISENLLLNILPGSVADELKLKGTAEAKHFETATILFSDFKDFTTVSENLSASELVEEINECFKAFDNIMTIFRMEKIKTIGDSYMAAGGIPETNTATALDVVHAGIEMQHFIIARKREREAQHLPAFEMRIGIHSGPVVAGIVGVKKFQYDLWGDTVNIASRMESSSAVGRVNISEATYQLIKGNQDLLFTPRGMVHAKGKGDMAMYFVDPAEPLAKVV